MPGGVQGLDRYAYANNNPVRYNDPTGHCTGDPKTAKGDEADCWDYYFEILNKYGSKLLGPAVMYPTYELYLIKEALSGINQASPGSTVGVIFLRLPVPVGEHIPTAITPPSMNTIFLFDGTFFNLDGTVRTYFESLTTIIHEMGHIFDFKLAESLGGDEWTYKSRFFVSLFNKGSCAGNVVGCLSNTQTTYSKNFFWGHGYDPIGGTTSYGGVSQADDFAESVVAYTLDVNNINYGGTDYEKVDIERKILVELLINLVP